MGVRLYHHSLDNLRFGNRKRIPPGEQLPVLRQGGKGVVIGWDQSPAAPLGRPILQQVDEPVGPAVQVEHPMSLVGVAGVLRDVVRLGQHHGCAHARARQTSECAYAIGVAADDNSTRCGQLSGSTTRNLAWGPVGSRSTNSTSASRKEATL